MEDNKIHVVTIKQSNYCLDENQILNIASEFYGKGLDTVSDNETNLIEIGFYGDFAEKHADLFQGYLEKAFKKN